MTRQNKIHIYVREYEQYRKLLIRRDRRGKPLPYRSRKWWKAWYKTYLSRWILAEEDDDDSRETD